MELTLLAKDTNSGVQGCPGVHLDRVSGSFVITGAAVDRTQVENVLPDETVIRIDPMIVIEAVRRYQTEGGL